MHGKSYEPHIGKQHCAYALAAGIAEQAAKHDSARIRWKGRSTRTTQAHAEWHCSNAQGQDPSHYDHSSEDRGEIPEAH